MHLFDKALNQHFQFVNKYGENAPYDLYEYEIVSRFGSVYDDPMVELKYLKQSGDVQAYEDQFEMLLNKVDLTQLLAVCMSFFLGGGGGFLKLSFAFHLEFLIQKQ